MSPLETVYRAIPRPLQTVALNLKAAQLYFERYGPKFERMAAKFGDCETLPREGWEARQSERLLQLVRHAYDSVPFYRHRFRKMGLRPHDIKGIEDLPKLPIITRDDVREHFDALVSTRYRASRLRRGHTSGTTGSPLNVAYDIPTCVAHHVVDWRQKAWGGLHRGEPYASLQGRVVVPKHTNRPPFWRYNYVNRQLFLSAFHLREDFLPHYVTELRRRGIRFIEGYPSTLYTLAAFLDQRGERLALKAAFTSSETLFDWQRTVIERTFVCRVFDAYGMAERCVYASECDRHHGRHLNEDYGITEFVDTTGHPVARGERGVIVATSLHNFAFPIIRYRTNDVSALSEEDCSCGRSYRLMDAVATKQEAIITLPDGRWISPSVLTHPFKPITRVAASQIVQDDLYHVRVRIVRRAGYTADDERLLSSGFRDRLGDAVDVQIEYVDDVMRTDSGKFKWVVSNVKPAFGAMHARDKVDP